MKPIHSTMISSPQLMLEVQRLLELGQSENALEQLKAGNRQEPIIRNARGVCMMRLGRYDDAIAELYPLVLTGSPHAINPQSSAIFRANFVALVAMRGDPLQALSMLDDMPDQDHPLLSRIRDALRAWRRSVPLWQWPLLVVGVYPSKPLDWPFTPGWLLSSASA